MRVKSIVWGVLFLLLGGAAQGEGRLTLLFAYENKANPPYYLAEQEGKGLGVTPDLLQRVGQRIGFDVKFMRVPWLRALKLLEANKVDGVFHASFKVERLAFGAYPMFHGEVDEGRKVMQQSYVLYKPKGSPLAWDGVEFSALEGVIGVDAGYTIVKDLRKLGVEVQENSSTRANMEMLLKQRVAGVVALENMADAVLDAQGEEFQELVKVLLPIKTKAYHLMLSRGLVQQSPQLAEQIWNVARDIRLSAEYRNLLHSYMH